MRSDSDVARHINRRCSDRPQPARTCTLFERDRLERWLAGTPLAIAPTTTEVYKWRDAQGRWHITDELPAGDVSYETLHYRSKR